MKDLRVIHKIVNDKKVRCNLSELHEGDWFTICEPTGEGLPRNDNMTEYYESEHRFLAVPNPSLIDGNWGIAVSGDTL